MLDYDVVRKTAVMAQPLTDKPLELAVQVIHPFGQFSGLCRCPASKEAIRHIAVLPVAELLDILADTEAVQRNACAG